MDLTMRRSADATTPGQEHSAPCATLTASPAACAEVGPLGTRGRLPEPRPAHGAPYRDTPQGRVVDELVRGQVYVSLEPSPSPMA